jgi:hypothetical protein
MRGTGEVFTDYEKYLKRYAPDQSLLYWHRLTFVVQI